MLFGGPPRSQPLAEGWTSESNYEVLKSATWSSSENGWDQWITRGLFLSVRLLHVFKKIKANGFFEATCQKPIKPNKDESTWITEKLQFIKSGGIPLHPEGTVSDEDSKWFRAYLKTHAHEMLSTWDVNAIEKRLRTKLPKSYLDFIESIGPVTFGNVDEQEWFTVSILPPDRLGEEEFADEFEDEGSKAVSGLTFAITGHGDCFCFDVQKGKKEYPVFHYKHEYNHLEPYAENFVACLRRFADGGNS